MTTSIPQSPAPAALELVKEWPIPYAGSPDTPLPAEGRPATKPSPYHGPQIQALTERVYRQFAPRLNEVATASGLLTTDAAGRVLAAAIVTALEEENQACEEFADATANRLERSGDAVGCQRAQAIAAGLRQRRGGA